LKAVINQEQTSLARVEQLGFSLEFVQGMLMAGESSRARHTIFHPPGAPGFNAWSDSVAYLREHKAGSDWEVKNIKGLPVIIDRKSNRAFGITSGDKATGTRFHPKSKNPKGKASFGLIQRNSDQLSFDELQLGKMPKNIDADYEIELWLFVIYRHDEGMRSELSLPLSIDEEGFISGWAERNIFPEISFEPQIPDPRKTSDNNSEEIVVEVTRKS